MRSLIVRTGARLLFPLLLTFALFITLRGHNAPGGGFIGGLIGATGFVLHAISCGADEARRALRVPPEKLAMAGLGVALFAGVMALFSGDAFFVGQWLFLGATETEKGLPVSSVLVFDVGVYLVVLGSILTLTFAFEDSV